MNNFKKIVFAGVLIMFAGPSPMSHADDEMNFDAIVEELGGSSRTGAPEDRDPFSTVKIHASLGMTAAYVDVEPERGPGASGLLAGAEATLGIDLFSPQWQAEGALRSFNSERLDAETTVSLKEFDLKILHTLPLASKLKMQLGAGLAARYMNVKSPYTNGSEYTTPASILGVGFKFQLSKVVGLGIEGSFRTALVDDTVDKSAINGSLRLNAVF